MDFKDLLMPPILRCIYFHCTENLDVYDEEYASALEEASRRMNTHRYQIPSICEIYLKIAIGRMCGNNC